MNSGRSGNGEPMPKRDGAVRLDSTILISENLQKILVPMSDVTRILIVAEAGDPRAAEQLLPLVYDELRKLAAVRMANERPGLTLQATALVHEAYLRLVGSADAL